LHASAFVAVRLAARGRVYPCVLDAGHGIHSFIGQGPSVTIPMVTID
jgi:hypothetical protein